MTTKSAFCITLALDACYLFLAALPLQGFLTHGAIVKKEGHLKGLLDDFRAYNSSKLATLRGVAMCVARNVPKLRCILHPARSLDFEASASALVWLGARESSAFALLRHPQESQGVFLPRLQHEKARRAHDITL